jgi:hypothetical protein
MWMLGGHCYLDRGDILILAAEETIDDIHQQSTMLQMSSTNVQEATQ